MKKQTELSERQRKAIEAIVAKGGTNRKAMAVAAGVPYSTLLSWFEKPVFDAALKAALIPALHSLGEKYERLQLDQPQKGRKFRVSVQPSALNQQV